MTSVMPLSSLLLSFPRRAGDPAHHAHFYSGGGPSKLRLGGDFLRGAGPAFLSDLTHETALPLSLRLVERQGRDIHPDLPPGKATAPTISRGLGRQGIERCLCAPSPQTEPAIQL